MLQLSSEISPSSLIEIISAHLSNPGNDLDYVGMQGIDLPSTQFPMLSIEFKHQDSLHPHDAVARLATGVKI
ncbi:MAG: hypothetical protein ACK4S8_05500 [Alishewanella aestuarii]